jgi:hypothetical protein
MATFRCLQSGNTVTFTLPHDIASMKGHSGYVRVDEEEKEEDTSPEAIRQDTAFVAPVIRRLGRPRKVANV